MSTRDDVEQAISAVYYGREGADDFSAEADAACNVIAGKLEEALRADGLNPNGLPLIAVAALLDELKGQS